MIDIHCHILPDVDDGAPDMETSLRLAKEAEKQGITAALLTPHHMDGQYINHLKDVEKETIEFQKQIDEHGINLKVFPGQEVHITGDLLKEIDDGDILFADPYNRYIMLELPHTEVPEYTEDMLFELNARGITPVIVHPERNHGFQNDHDLLYKFVAQGAATQLTASSYVGVFGPEVEKLTEEIIAANLGTTFGSDTHNFKGRRYRMKDAYAKLEKQFGVKMATRYKFNAKAIINGDDIDQGEIKPIKKKKKKKFLGLF
ncbi:tyrosine-protein phosphatase [Fructilactobacillus sanfranciscensis]|uniref:tyrosine-protein phosphatase n=1 Tax=Fructilactobacillus sanfranciscensis TaxID=1625 RepID=UPI0031F846FC